MPTIPPPPGLEPEDYESIEAAVLETPRGRWFLAEFARRLREQESARLLEAVGKLERVVRDLAERPVAMPVPTLGEASRPLELAAPGAADGPASPLIARIEAFGRAGRSHEGGGGNAPAAVEGPAAFEGEEAFAPLEAMSVLERLRLFH